ncbi:Hsp20 family protein [Caulobacter segnis]
MSPAFDFSPLYSTMIGVDRMVDLVETALRSQDADSYPPYDIEKTGEDAYRISVAAAGFAPDELEVTTQPNLVVVKGRRTPADGEAARRRIHQGLARRSFERRFELADHLVVKEARHAHGVLAIDLVREVPEASKPKQIPIGTGLVSLARNAAKSPRAA